MGLLAFYVGFTINTIIFSGIPLATIIWFIVRHLQWSRIRFRYVRILIVTSLTTVIYMPAYIALSYAMSTQVFLAMFLMHLIIFLIDFLLFTLLLRLKPREALLISLVGTILVYPVLLIAFIMGSLLGGVYNILWLSPLP